MVDMPKIVSVKIANLIDWYLFQIQKDVYSVWIGVVDNNLSGLKVFFLYI